MFEISRKTAFFFFSESEGMSDKREDSSFSLNPNILSRTLNGEEKVQRKILMPSTHINHTAVEIMLVNVIRI